MVAKLFGGNISGRKIIWCKFQWSRNHLAISVVPGQQQVKNLHTWESTHSQSGGDDDHDDRDEDDEDDEDDDTCCKDDE